ncbi:thioesterase-like superfamily-domain-containing protein [Fusarium flagelliforme]|uniref:thioesterase-like superfamily-domain-containing protein n=1 Tax=Fusarium flagelliforme TaxID=2675880 RepID=UPI001E8DBCA0|nr:thioesterase-like superfamily-domain-containing protein [Fusarium flagelliforme]KAH7199013.1 thioesterase-like superfamily-domain-containing protein [Fusarium flagelliforme]
MSSSIVSFKAAVRVAQLTDHSWSGNLVQEYCVGAVPNGGYVASVMYQAVESHVQNLGLGQDIISAQLQYVNRTQIGDAKITIETIKSGRATSTFHAVLLQGTRKCVLGYFVCVAPTTNGLTLATGWHLLPPAPPIDFERAVKGLDPNWSSGAGRIQIDHLASLGFVRAVEGVFESYYRRQPGHKGLEDAWIRLSSGELLTNASLPLVADAKPYVVESWRPLPGESSEGVPFSRNDPFWYPTLVMNLDIKKLLPKEGVEWLFIRTEARKIDQGRLDLQVSVLDQEGDLVAVASHINLVLSASRNLGNKTAKVSKGNL